MGNPLLTLPPEVGRTYRYRNGKKGVNRNGAQGGTCVITHQGTFQGEMTFNSRAENGDNWMFWADGKAKIHPYGPTDHVAYLTEDVYTAPELPPSEEFKELKARIESIKQRLKELQC